MPDYIKEKVEEYCKKFGVCNEDGKCDCAREIKWLKSALNQAYDEGAAEACMVCNDITVPMAVKTAHNQAVEECQRALPKEGFEYSYDKDIDITELPEGLVAEMKGVEKGYKVCLSQAQENLEKIKIQNNHQ